MKQQSIPVAVISRKLPQPYKLATKIIKAVSKAANGVECYEFYKRYGTPPGYLAKVLKNLEKRHLVYYKDYKIYPYE